VGYVPIALFGMLPGSISVKLARNPPSGYRLAMSFENERNRIAVVTARVG
jgi:hypothetical protein